MIKVTQDLKYTLQINPHIKEVYFDKFGNHFLNAFPHKDTGVLYHTIKDYGQKEVSKGTEKRVRVYEVNPDHELVDTLSANEVLNTPLEDAPVFEDKNTTKIFEEQAKEFAKLSAQVDDMKKDLSEMEQLKAELAKANEEKELLSQMLEEKEKSDATPAELPKADAEDKSKKNNSGK